MIDLEGRTVFLIGGGESAGHVRLEGLHRLGAVVAVNDSYSKLPRMDAVFSADGCWVSRRARALRRVDADIFAAVPFSYVLPDPSALPRCTLLERRDGAQLSRDPRIVYYAGNSGFGALCWAAAQRPARICLIGYDMHGGHWHGGYEWPCRFGQDDYADWTVAFWLVAKDLRAWGIDVVNLSLGSAIKCFRFATLDDLAEEDAA